MGISGLLPLVKAACSDANIADFRGMRVAVDVSCLLHRGLFGYMDMVARGVDTNGYVLFVEKYIDRLRELDCRVILVFDGAPLPAKKDVNDERRIRRSGNLSAGLELLQQGKQGAAFEYLKKATHVTPEMVAKVIEHFRVKPGVDIVVAPYEADAQLAFFALNGFADLLVTQDSDLIVFGCQKIFFKWDLASGAGVLYNRNLLPGCFQRSFSFSFEKFRRICILSGCDYLKNGLKGVGLAKAINFFSRVTNPDLLISLKKISFVLRIKETITDEFVREFINAELTFLHQTVFNPVTRQQQPLHPYRHENEGEWISEFAGKQVCSEEAVRAALGNLLTEKHDRFRLKATVPKMSIWSPEFECMPCDQFELYDPKAVPPRTIAPKNFSNECLSPNQLATSTSACTPTTKVTESSQACQTRVTYYELDYKRLFSTPTSRNSPCSSQSSVSSQSSQVSLKRPSSQTDESDFHAASPKTPKVESPSITNPAKRPPATQLSALEIHDYDDDVIVIEDDPIAQVTHSPKKDHQSSNSSIEIVTKVKTRKITSFFSQFARDTISNSATKPEKKISPSNNSTPSPKTDAISRIRSFGYRSAGLYRVKPALN